MGVYIFTVFIKLLFGKSNLERKIKKSKMVPVTLACLFRRKLTWGESKLLEGKYPALFDTMYKALRCVLCASVTLKNPRKYPARSTSKSTPPFSSIISWLLEKRVCGATKTRLWPEKARAQYSLGY